MNPYPPYDSTPRYSPPAHPDPYRSNSSRPPYGFPPPPSLPPFRPYDPYANASAPPRPPFHYDQPRPPAVSEAYDPYRPSSTAYDPGRPSLQTATINHYPPPRPVSFASPPVRPAQSSQPQDPGRQSEQELSLLTPPTSVTVEGHTAIVHSLPPSHLPLVKYVSVNKDDALSLHSHLTTREASIWYADGSNRAGEGWSAAVEWIYESGRSGSKMRGCVGEGDALDAELGGIYKAVEGFHELLRQSLKNATQMSHHLIIFSDSQPAIIGIDTCTRPEAVKFDHLWRDICTEFIRAHLTIVWIPRQNVIEGHILADKIAVVGASNAYAKKKKDAILPDIYRRPGGGEPSPPASTLPGDWQRGDSEPGLRKPPFTRPVPRHLSPAVLPAQALRDASPAKAEHAAVDPPIASREGPDLVEEEIPKEGSVFVTHFPDSASAKDLGILFSQFGSIEAVDIYHVSPAHPRLAYVAFLEPQAGPMAIADLHQRKVRLDTPFAQSNSADFDVWRDWNGVLTVVMAEPPRLVPSAVSSDFPDLPDWARRDQAQSRPAISELPTLANGEKRREREFATSGDGGAQSRAMGSSNLSLSPRKRPRSRSPSDDPAHAVGTADAVDTHDTTDSQPGLGLMRRGDDDARTRGSDTPHTPHSLSIEPPVTSDAVTPATQTVHDRSDQAEAYDKKAEHITLPPTPTTAERPRSTTDSLLNPERLAETSRPDSKAPLTNSAAEPQEHPIKLSSKALHGLIDLVRDVFAKHEPNNWIAHSCLIAFELDQARRALQGDLYATDEAFLAGREHEQILTGRGFTPARVDAFITKVLKVLDGIAAAEEEPNGDGESTQNLESLQLALDEELGRYPNETREAVMSAGTLMEYLLRGKELQEKKRLDIERRVKVLEGMVKIGEVVGGVVRFLLTEDR